MARSILRMFVMVAALFVVLGVTSDDLPAQDNCSFEGRDCISVCTNIWGFREYLYLRYRCCWGSEEDFSSYCRYYLVSAGQCC